MMNQIQNHSYGAAVFWKFCVGEHEAISRLPLGVYRKRFSDNCLIVLRNNSAILQFLRWFPITLLVLCLLLGVGGEKANAAMTTKEEKELGEKASLK
jgi:hypothetical protein